MTKQPYIYTLPEQFIEDKSVPLRWKLYAIVNGFWISGKDVFASNKFFAEKLKCSERHVIVCLADLEKVGVLKRVGTSQNRRIVPGGELRVQGGGELSEVEGGEPGVQHISVSNSDSINGEATASQDYEYVSEDDERPRKVSKAKYPNKVEIYRLWSPRYPSVWNRNTTICESAENLKRERGTEKVKIMVDYWKEYRNDKLCPDCSDPYLLDLKWRKLVRFLKDKGEI